MSRLLSVLIPVYNEERTIAAILSRVLTAPYDKEVIVVDDGSTDSTCQVLEEWSDRCTTVRHGFNRGKGAAIRTGLALATGRFTIVQDADLEYDPQDFPRLVEPLLAGADVVFGSRYLNHGRVRSVVPAGRNAAWSMRMGVSMLNWVVRILYGVTLTDEATCYKAFPTETLRAMELTCERFEFCPEVTAKALRMGLAIVEVPVHYNARNCLEGKKLRLRDGFHAVRTLWRLRQWAPMSSRTGAFTPVS